MNPIQIATYTESFIQIISGPNYAQVLPNWRYEIVSGTSTINCLTEASFRIDEGATNVAVINAVVLRLGLPQNTQIPINTAIDRPHYFRVYLP